MVAAVSHYLFYCCIDSFLALEANFFSRYGCACKLPLHIYLEHFFAVAMIALSNGTAIKSPVYPTQMIIIACTEPFPAVEGGVSTWLEGIETLA